jgi:hypothetical protein
MIFITLNFLLSTIFLKHFLTEPSPVKYTSVVRKAEFHRAGGELREYLAADPHRLAQTKNDPYPKIACCACHDMTGPRRIGDGIVENIEAE